MTLYSLLVKIDNFIHRLVVEPFVKRSFGECGADVCVPKGCRFLGVENVICGSSVHFGFDNIILSTRAKVIIGDSVMFGPNVQIITGNHRTNIVGRTMISITDSEKLPEDDQDVRVGDDVWIGASAILLKGITVGTGSVIAAGSVVTKDVPEYSIVAGVPARVIKSRFDENQLKEHISIIGRV